MIEGERERERGREENVDGLIRFKKRKVSLVTKEAGGEEQSLPPVFVLPSS